MNVKPCRNYMLEKYFVCKTSDKFRFSGQLASFDIPSNRIMNAETIPLDPSVDFLLREAPAQDLFILVAISRDQLAMPTLITELLEVGFSHAHSYLYQDIFYYKLRDIVLDFQIVYGNKIVFFV